MKGTLLTVAATLAISLSLGVGLVLFVIYTGAYDVAATTPHAGITRWALNTLQESSVGRRAEEMQGAAPTDSAALAAGFHHFQAMCVQCHGAPGMARGELGQGMRPRPPRLEEAADEWTDAELFWIVKNGIRLAGMPAFGPTHSDRDLRGIVAFTRSLETMTEEEYAELVRTRTAAAGEGGGGLEDGAGGHSHAPGTEPHGH